VLNQGFIFVDNPMDEVIVLNFNTTKWLVLNIILERMFFYGREIYFLY
jgi:hypothetical protein